MFNSWGAKNNNFPRSHIINRLTKGLLRMMRIENDIKARGRGILIILGGYMSCLIERMERELEGHLIMEPRQLEELTQAIDNLGCASDRISQLIEENTLKLKQKQHEEVE